MKKALLLIALLLSSACHLNYPASYTPETKQEYVLLDVVDGLGALQLAAENAVPAKILTNDEARDIVKFTVAANTAITKSPDGWYAIVSSSYTSLKASLPLNAKDNFQYAFTAFELILDSFSGQR